MPFAGMPYYASTHVPLVPMVGGGGDMSTNAHLADAARNDVSLNACFLLFVLFVIRFRNTETARRLVRVPCFECATKQTDAYPQLAFQLCIVMMQILSLHIRSQYE